MAKSNATPKYWPWTDSYAKITLRKAHATIQRRHGFEPRSGGYVFEQPVLAIADRSVDTAFAIMADQLSALAKSHVFDVEIRRQIRDYG